jgi:EmrB/QacA subfamily drug resistance transporter
MESLSMHHVPHVADDQAGTNERRSWSLLVLLCVAQFMVILDITVVNVALPAIGAGLDFPVADLSWVVTAYVLCTGGLVLLGGRAADHFDRRMMLLLGLATFTAASLACGAAPTAEALVAARAVQGVGAALLTPAALSIIITAYTGAQRRTALTIWSAIGSGGAGAGVLLGGMLTSWLSWEWVFLVNVPVGLVALALTPHVVPPAPPARSSPRQLDLTGATALMLGLATLVYALQGTAEHGWSSLHTIGLLAGAAAVLAAFAAWERSSTHPLVPVSTWRVRSLVSGSAVMLGATGVMAGTFFLNSLYLQGVLELSAVETGLGLLPTVIAIGVGAHLGGHLIMHAGARAILGAGLLVIALGAALLALAPGHAAYARDLLAGLALIGLGIGGVFASVSIVAMRDVEDAHAGLASGLMSTAHEVGAALGVAVLAAVASAASGFIGGYGDGLWVASGIAVALAAVALVAIPPLGPAQDGPLTAEPAGTADPAEALEPAGGA